VSSLKLRDLGRVKMIAGKGGDGGMHFGPYKIPMGGIGGNGGDIYIEGNSNLYDLRFMHNDMVIKGNHGEKGGKKNLTGKNGDDVIFKVPLITKVYDAETDEIIGTIKEHGQKLLICKGGIGGLGNYYFRAGQVRTLEKTTPGKPGEERLLKLELNLKADVIFLGLPNAGKSSILNELTNANSKIAHYAFTTLDPVLGNLDGISLMDLPGLIEGTFTGKGLGTKFKKHAETAKLVLHFLSLDSDNILEDYRLIRNELKNISPKLYKLPEVIVLTKSDLVDEQLKSERKSEVENIGKPIIITSAYDYDSLQKLRNLIKEYIRN
jgi:GTP-binding protein